MIRPLRRLHGRIWALLTVALLAAYAAALLTRPAQPKPSPLPAALEGSP